MASGRNYLAPSPFSCRCVLVCFGVLSLPWEDTALGSWDTEEKGLGVEEEERVTWI